MLLASLQNCCVLRRWIRDSWVMTKDDWILGCLKVKGSITGHSKGSVATGRSMD